MSMNSFRCSRKPDFQESLIIWGKKIGCNHGECSRWESNEAILRICHGNASKAARTFRREGDGDFVESGGIEIRRDNDACTICAIDCCIPGIEVIAKLENGIEVGRSA